jgi:hypothetical protein
VAQPTRKSPDKTVATYDDHLRKVAPYMRQGMKFMKPPIDPFSIVIACAEAGQVAHHSSSRDSKRHVSLFTASVHIQRCVAHFAVQEHMNCAIYATHCAPGANFHSTVFTTLIPLQPRLNTQVVFTTLIAAPQNSGLTLGLSVAVDRF